MVTQNQLLSSLVPECLEFLANRLLTKPVVSGEVLYIPDSPIQNLIFPHSGLISLQATLSDAQTVEKVSVGSDGFAGFEYMLGITQSQCCAVVLVSGTASWLPAHSFAEAASLFPCVNRAMTRFVAYTFKRVTQGIVCASVHNATQRISTWLLHAHDRNPTAPLDITQRNLADVLGLRLATVSQTCNRLMSEGAVAYARGQLSITSRTKLKAFGCECYDAARLV